MIKPLKWFNRSEKSIPNPAQGIVQIASLLNKKMAIKKLTTTVNRAKIPRALFGKTKASIPTINGININEIIIVGIILNPLFVAPWSALSGSEMQ